MELEYNSSLNFLDWNISKRGGKLEFNIYRKATTIVAIVHNNSIQPINIKIVAFDSLIHRQESVKTVKTTDNCK